MKADKQIDRATLEEQFRSYAEQLSLDVEVFSDGPVTSEIAIVGEGPGEVEVRHPQRLPFVGGSGNLLWDSLRKYGIHRNHVYTSNVVKRQISLSRKGNEKHIVHADELGRWTGLVKWELGQLPNLRIIFAMGNFALDALTANDGITKWRGSVLDMELPNGKMGKIVCAFNPAYALRELRFEPIFRMDCGKLSKVAKNTFKAHKIDEIINPTFKESLAFIRDLQKSTKPVSFDIETMNTPESVCYGLGNDAHRAMCINLRDAEQNRFSTQQEVDILLALQKLFDSHKIIAQNGSFDAYHVGMRDYLQVRVWFDTLLGHHTLYPQLPHNLAFLVSQYTNHPFYKDEGKAWKEGQDVETYWKYNCKDVALTFASYEGIERELQQQGLEKFFHSHVMRAQPHLVQATIQGVAVDMPMKSILVEQVSKDVDNIKAEFHRLVHELTEDYSYYPNPGSWQQLQELFFERLGLKGKGYSTDEANRAVMMSDPRTPALAKEMLAVLNKWKEEDKFRGTYAESKVSADNRFRCEYKQYGVSRAPGRLSSAALIYDEGGNMQNQPVRARGMYVADPGCVLCYFDLAQAEARVVAYRANIPKWKEQFEQARLDGKYDCHRALASEMFKVAYDLVPVIDFDENGKPTIRYIAKRCRHGLNYRMQRWRLAEVTGLPFNQASRSWVIYHSITPELRKWWAAEEKGFRATREIYNALGRRFKVIQRIDDNVLESIIAYYPQSSIGDKVTQVWYQVEEDDKWPDRMYARVAIDVHDNLVAISSPKYAKTCLHIMKKYAESPMTIQDVYKNKPEQLIIPAELKISYPTLWNDKKKVFESNKKGLHRWSNMEKVEL